MDWLLIKKIERDICYMYHEQAEYTGLMGDLNYAGVYNLPYWEFLDIDTLPEPQREFLREGCLVLILAMCLETLEGAGSWIVDKSGDCRTAIDRLGPSDARTTRLVSIVRTALDLVDADGTSVPRSHDLNEACAWVNQEFVQRYFQETGYTARASG